MNIPTYLTILLFTLTAIGQEKGSGVNRTYSAIGWDLKKADSMVFQYAHEENEEGDILTFKNIYTQTDKTMAIAETGYLKNGLIQEISMEQKQIGETGKIHVENGQIHFSYTRGGVTKINKEKWVDNFVVGASLGKYIQAQWTRILKGEEIPLRLGVMDRRESIGFVLQKTDETTHQGQTAIVVRMKAQSFVIAMAVDPLFFTIGKDSKRVLEVRGRTLVKKQENGKWKDQDARVAYQYP